MSTSDSYKRGASLWQKILITFDDIKTFATDRFVPETMAVDWLLYVMVFLTVLAPTAYFLLQPYTYDEGVKEVELVSGGNVKALSPLDEAIFEIDSDVVCKLRKGAKVTLLAYDENKDYFQVETEDGERGFIAGEIVSGKIDKEADEIREVAVGVPEFSSGGGLNCTKVWFEKTLVAGKTTKEEIDGKWWGYSLSYDRKKDSEVCYYPMYVFDGKQVICKVSKVTFKDGVVSEVGRIGEGKRKSLIGRIPGTEFVENNDLYVRFNMDSVTHESDYGVEDDSIKIPKWLSWILVIVLGILALIVLLFWAECNYLFVPILLILVGRIRVIPGIIFRYLLCLAALYGALVFYVWWGGFGWFLTAVILAFAVFQLIQWHRWTGYNYCTKCRRFYTMATYDEQGGAVDYVRVHSSVKVKKDSSGNVIERKEGGEWYENRRYSSYTAYLECTKCGHRNAVNITSDRSA